MPSLSTRAARGAVQTVGAQLVRLGLQLVGIAVLARLLRVEDYALVAMVAAVIGLADILRDGGLSSAAVQSPTLDIEERDNLFWLNTALGAAAAVLATAATPLIVLLYHEPRLARIVPALAVTFLISGVNTQYRVSLGRDLRFGALGLADVISQGLGLVAAIVVAWLGGGYWALVTQQVTAALLALVVNASNCRWLPSWYHRGVSVRRFVGFGVRVFTTQALSYGTQSVDTIALGAAGAPFALGLYNRASQIVITPLSQINVPLSRVAIPVLSRAQDDDTRFGWAVGRAQLVGAYVTATVLALVAGLARPITDLLLGPRWVAVAPILAVLSLSGVFRAVAHLNYWLFLARGAVAAQLRLDLVARPLMILVIIAGVPWSGIGVATSSTVAWALYWAVGVAVASRATHVPTGALVRRAVLALACVATPAGVGAHVAAGLVGGPAVLRIGAGLIGGLSLVAPFALAVAPVRRDLLTLRDLSLQVLGRRPGARPEARPTGVAVRQHG